MSHDCVKLEGRNADGLRHNYLNHIYLSRTYMTI